MIYDIGESSVSYVLKLQIGSRGHQFPLPKALEKEFAPPRSDTFPLPTLT